MATITLSPATATDPKRMTVSKVWDSMLCGARTIARVTGACEDTDLVSHENVT